MNDVLVTISERCTTSPSGLGTLELVSILKPAPHGASTDACAMVVLA